MKEQKFEDKLKELEVLNNKIKSGELALDETVVCFEKGMKIAKELEKEINSIERKVEILISEGSREFKDFQE
ncbi:MAG: exodeoxyribonuclease VII small subunit [Spirochaetaceae bacterium]|nr:exodeoxyribonuclease VII small subunit [Spirochaetaceae bacterium]